MALRPCPAVSHPAGEAASGLGNSPVAAAPAFVPVARRGRGLAAGAKSEAQFPVGRPFSRAASS